jgi:hypothetical protein
LPKPRFFLFEIGPRAWYGFKSFRELDLENCQPLIAEAYLRGREVEFPHSAESIAKDLNGNVAMREKTRSPGRKRIGIMKP